MVVDSRARIPEKDVQDAGTIVHRSCSILYRMNALPVRRAVKLVLVSIALLAAQASAVNIVGGGLGVESAPPAQESKA